MNSGCGCSLIAIVEDIVDLVFLDWLSSSWFQRPKRIVCVDTARFCCILTDPPNDFPCTDLPAFDQSLLVELNEFLAGCF
ncbi:hypothetical protein [Haladaptatus sp. DFWS20]|uniref:hypothetical protein n=1 Tax=Haladaptatus sp. DFWS20 TaxID=3403467 RepID=UPI003EBAF7EF